VITMFEKERTLEVTRKTAPYAPEEQLGTYRLRRWTWFEKQQVLEKAAKIIDAAKGIVETSISTFNLNLMLVCITEAPGGVSEKTIKELDESIGDLLFTELQSLNNLPQEAITDF